MTVLIEIRDRPGWDYRGHRVLVDELGWFSNRVEQHSESVKASHHASELHSAYQVDRHAYIFFTNLIQKNVL